MKIEAGDLIKGGPIYDSGEWALVDGANPGQIYPLFSKDPRFTRGLSACPRFDYDTGSGALNLTEPDHE